MAQQVTRERRSGERVKEDREDQPRQALDLDEAASERSAETNGNGGENLAQLKSDEVQLERAQAEIDRRTAELDLAQYERDRYLADLNHWGEGDVEETARELRLDRERFALERAQASADRLRASVDRRQAAVHRAQGDHDELTGALRRGPGLTRLSAELSRAQLSGTSLIVIFVDIEALQEASDSDGHTAGENLLSSVADLLDKQLRSYDFVIRYDEDQFLCVLPQTTVAATRHHLTHVGKALRDVSQALSRGVRGASICVGIAASREDDDVESLIERANPSAYKEREREQATEVSVAEGERDAALAVAESDA